jgi:hypothetical protein
MAMGNFYYWIPTMVAALVILVATLIVGATIPTEKNDKSKDAAR